MRYLLMAALAMMASLTGFCQLPEALTRELSLDGDISMRLTCPNPEGWSFSVEAGRLDGDRQSVDIRLARSTPAVPPQFNLRLLMPQCRIRHLWTVNDNRFPISPYLIGERVSSLCENMPLYVYLDDASTNRLAIGLSESDRHVVFHGGVEEVGSQIFSSFDFFVQPEAPLTNYQLTVCLDIGARHLADTVPSMVRWIEQRSGKHPCVAPSAAFDSLYSTWYGFHQDLSDRVIEDECERAAALGMKTVIVDDGWQMEQAGSAYRYCGDWHPAKSRFPDMTAHVRRVQALGLKYMLWYSVPFVGRDSENAARFKDKSLYYLERSGAYVLDPRFPEVRAFLVETYVQAARNWNLDGFKLDFIDRFRIEGVDPAVAENYAGRDIKSVPKAVDRLLSEIREALLKVRPDMLIEFRQSYIGPGIRPYGNMLRAGDCPGDLRQNRVAIANLRLVSGESAVHADMLEWNVKASPEDAALNVLAALFGTVQYSQVLRDAPVEHLRMMRHWISFAERHRSALLRGWFRPHHPELSYPLIEAGDGAEHILAVYTPNTIVEIGGDEPVKLVINATDAETVCVQLPCTMEAVFYDTFGSRTGTQMVQPGLVMLPVPKAGYAELTAKRVLAFDEFQDRMRGAWIGQSVGVAYGWPTEFKYKGKLVPEDQMPVWKPEMINETFNQDDLYVEMSFIDTLSHHGIDVSSRTAGIDFANSAYRVWCANANARNNLRNGIAAPASSHPAFHRTTDDIDYQIEADFSGILSPGLPQAAVDFGETFGRIMNYGDGLYAGQFIGAMYAEAYFETNCTRVVEKALQAIPAESKYAEMVRDMLAWHAAQPADWRETWRKAVDKYQSAPNLGKVSFPAIDVKINGAMVLLGLLYGDGDMDRTMYIATAGGYDSDCNPSSACGVLGTMVGMRKLDGKFHEALDRTRKWEFTDYDWDRLNVVCERLVRMVVVKYGGRIKRDSAGREWMILPIAPVRPSAWFDSARPGPQSTDVKLSAAEWNQIRYLPCEKEGAQSRLRTQTAAE